MPLSSDVLFHFWITKVLEDFGGRLRNNFEYVLFFFHTEK